MLMIPGGQVGVADITRGSVATCLAVDHAASVPITWRRRLTSSAG